MRSLVSVCAHRVVSDHASLRRAMHLIPVELYPALFAAAFYDHKTLALHDLVQRWPFPVLSFQKLLYGDGHSPVALRDTSSKQCVQSVILGVVAHLEDSLTKADTTNGTRARRLQVLDVTGMQEDRLTREPHCMSLWSSTVAVAKACIDIHRRCSEKVHPKTKRRKGLRVRPMSPERPVNSPHVDVRVDLFVNSTSFSVLREALLLSAHSPLRLQCRDLRVEELSLQSTSGLLALLSAPGVRKIDLRFNNLGFSGLNVLLPLMSRFTGLRSLKLPYSNIDVNRLTPLTEGALQTFTSLLGQLRDLRELNLGSSRLSGRLRQLLGGLQTPLESLELAFCYLLPADLLYLSASVHASTLRKVDLSGNNLSVFLLQPFQRLLGALSSVLLHLDITECKLEDVHLAAITPALCSCSRLRYLSFSCNPISSQRLRTFLLDTVRLAELRLVIHPLPTDCYNPRTPDDAADELQECGYDQEKVKQLGAELQHMLLHAQRTDMVWSTDLFQENVTDYLSP
uniref:Leucine-rich repeat-containing protein 14 n=1 Tax=Leptobrachium leishanense TaxID=445787 RepID=A0A8C5PPF9_9ANUR